MKPYRYLLGFLLAIYSIHSFSTEKQDIQTLREEVLKHVTNHYMGVFGAKEFAKNVSIQVSHLDRRLLLSQCDNNLAFKINEPPSNVRSITVKATCNAQNRWTVYVPVTIEVYNDVLVVNRSVKKGDILSNEDVSFRRVDVSAAGHGVISEVKRAEGMAMKRPLKPGEILLQSHLIKPKIVHKGQTVVLTSGSRFLSVETEGIALVSGHMGQQIRVKNPASNRIVSAEVIAPGRVAVATR